MINRRKDNVTRDRIDEIAYSNNKKLQTLKWLIYTLGVLWIVTFVMAAYLINDNRHRADRIQASRLTNMFNNCVDQNARNEHTKRVLHRVITASIKTGQITQNGGDASEKFTILLINALAPHRDCSKIILNQKRKTQIPIDKRTLAYSD